MATTQSTELKRPTLVGRLWEVAVFVACAWGAAHVVPGVELSGSLRRQAIVVLALSVIDQVLNMSTRYAARAGGQERLTRRFQRLGGLGCFGYLAIMLTALIGGPLTWWLGTLVADALSLPFQVNGFRPLVLAPLVVYVLSWLPLQAVRLLTDPGLRPVLSGQILRVSASVGGFAVLLAVGVIGFEPDTWWRTGISLVVVAGLYHVLNLHMNYSSDGWPAAAVKSILVRGSVIALVVGVAVNAVVLWAVAWASQYVGLSMHVNGFWPLVGAAAFLLALSWSVSTPLALRRMRRVLAAQGVTEPDDPVWLVVRVGRHGFMVEPLNPV